MACVKTTEEIQLWERQPGESRKAFEAFCIYRDQGADRSQRAVCEKLAKSRALISRWSAQYGWVDRAAAWDAEQDKILRRKQIQDIKRMRETHANLATAMLVKAARALQRIPDDEIRAQDICRMVEVAAHLERESRGDSGEVVEVRDGGTAPDLVQFYIPDNNRDREEL